MTRQLFSVVLIGVFAALLAGCGRQAEVVEAQAQPGVVSAMGQSLALFVASDSLGLTPEQKQLIEAAMKKHQAAVQALMGQLRSGAITRDDFQSKLAALEQQLEEELKSILTPEQYERGSSIKTISGRMEEFPIRSLLRWNIWPDCSA